MRDRGAGAATSTWTLLAGGLVSTSTLTALAVAGSLLLGATAGRVALGLDLVLVAAFVLAGRAVRRRPDLPLVAGRRLLGWVNARWRRPTTQGATTLARWTEELQAVRPGLRGWTAAVASGPGTGCSTAPAWRPLPPPSAPPG